MISVIFHVDNVEAWRIKSIYQLCGVLFDADGDDDDYDDDEDEEDYDDASVDDGVVDSDDIRSSQGQCSPQGNLFDSPSLKKDLMILMIITSIFTYHQDYHITSQ